MSSPFVDLNLEKKSLNLFTYFFFCEMSVEVGLVTYNALSDLFQSEYFVILLWKSVDISSPQMNIYTHTYIHYIDVHLINFSLYVYLFSLLLIKP